MHAFISNVYLFNEDDIVFIILDFSHSFMTEKGKCPEIHTERSRTEQNPFKCLISLMDDRRANE